MASRISIWAVLLITAIALVSNVPGQTNGVTNLWRELIKSPIDSSPAIAGDGTIYFGTFAGELYAMRPDGSHKWVYQTGVEIHSSPAVGGDGTIYFGCRDNRLYAVTPEGKLKWRFATGGWVDSSPALETDGTIYFGSWDKMFYALHPDGSKKWAFLTGGEITSSPAIGADGSVYFGSHDKKFYAVDQNGSKQWDFATGGGIVSSPAIATDGTIYIPSTDGRLYALTPEGKRKWTVKLGCFTKCSPAIDQNGNIFTDAAGFLVSLRPDGTERWRCRMIATMPMHTSPALTADGCIIVYQANGGLAGIGQDGEMQFDVWADSLAESSPVINKDGMIFIGSGAAQFMAFQISSSLADAPWPMFRHDLRHTGKASSLK